MDLKSINMKHYVMHIIFPIWV